MLHFIVICIILYIVARVLIGVLCASNEILGEKITTGLYYLAILAFAIWIKLP